MGRFISNLIRIAPAAATVLALLVFASSALACPTCKENLAGDPEAANIARGYFYSILFMLSMPPLILSGLSLYFYYEVCKARARQAKAAAEGNSSQDEAGIDVQLIQA